MNRTTTKLSLQEFLALPESDERYELVDGEPVPKMSPTSPHSRAQKRLTSFPRDELPQTFEANEAISDPLLPRLEIHLSSLFSKRS
jgi:Uma2 family endonuclease